jgi:diguanylate cyclase (GGDEF)-like protein
MNGLRVEVMPWEDGMHTENGLARDELLSCVQLGKTLTAELHSEQLFGKILEKVSELLPAENWSLLLVDDDTNELRFELSVDLPHELMKDVSLRMGEGVAGKAAQEQRPIVVSDAWQCEFFSNRVDSLSGTITRSIICVPLVFGGKSLGVIEVINPRDPERNPLPLLSIIADYAAIAVENMKRYRRIRNMAIRDDLTGLYNTRQLYASLSDLVAGKDHPFSLIFMDLDNFKRVVDTYGHLKGSQALQEVARTIRACLEEPAFGVAYGGDEFVAVLQGYNKGRALGKAEEIRQRMKETLYLTDHGHEVRLKASFGIATYPDDAGDVRGLLALADRAMFRVKEGGKDAVRSA